ncbi:hypothetical protein MTR_1g033270 [Medicago truncatula]|uniref:Uncharacterized protein n=1 Tax=Medicago truncatula TaxID=3880 RepID=A0A072VGW3_MEDTR|nr:hypothetical protein MTR_1g033270 [Medicago truncatula]
MAGFGEGHTYKSLYHEHSLYSRIGYTNSGNFFYKYLNPTPLISITRHISNVIEVIGARVHLKFTSLMNYLGSIILVA